jgi:hypothetical protein
MDTGKLSAGQPQRLSAGQGSSAMALELPAVDHLHHLFHSQSKNCALLLLFLSHLIQAGSWTRSTRATLRLYATIISQIQA